MTRFRKTITASLAALTIGAGVIATSASPAAAWGGYGWHHGWGGGGIAAGVLGGLALGAVAASASPYYGGYGCTATQGFYDSWGYVHYRRVAVPC
jgi:hypothetical protein